MNYEKMRILVENYFLNIRERDRILMNYADPIHAPKRIKKTCYSDFKTSKTEREAIRNISRDKEVAYVTRKIELVDKNLDVLTEEERKIINYIKYGDKVMSISRTIGMERRKVAKLRDTAIHKMVAKVNRNVAIVS